MLLSKNNVVHICTLSFKLNIFQRIYHRIPFLDVYQKTTGNEGLDIFCHKIKKKYPHIEALSHDRLQCTLQILKKYGISAVEAFQSQNLHIFTMNPITMDNYASILHECGFIKVEPKHIIRYHTHVRSRTIKSLKKEGLLKEDLNMEKLIQDQIKEWPDSQKTLENFQDLNTCILQIRLSILEKYLQWRLLVTSDEFHKYCRNYLPLKHKPMSDIQEALDVAQNDIKFDKLAIKKNGFVISSDPVNTKLILNNVEAIAGLDIREAIRLEPAILKNNYNALLEIKSLLEEYRIPMEAQRKCIKVFCMCPKTVKIRLEELRNLKEYQVLKSNPRVLSLVVYKRKMMDRLKKIDLAKKQCFSLNHLVSSNKVFNNYIGSFGSKICGRDLAILIGTSLHFESNSSTNINDIMNQMKRHKYYLHTALDLIDENIKYLKKSFDNNVIVNNCHLLLYPLHDIKQYTEYLRALRKELREDNKIQLKSTYNNLKFSLLSDSQILSLTLYEIEKKYHFSGDGVWTRQEGVKMESHS